MQSLQEVIRARSLKCRVLPGDWMPNLQPHSMEGCPPNEVCRGRSVEGVAQDGMTQGRGVGADLMSAASER